MEKENNKKTQRWVLAANIIARPLCGPPTAQWRSYAITCAWTTGGWSVQDPSGEARTYSPGTETIPNPGSRAHIIQQTSRGSISSVSKPTFASKYLCCSIFKIYTVCKLFQKSILEMCKMLHCFGRRRRIFRIFTQRLLRGMQNFPSHRLFLAIHSR